MGNGYRVQVSEEEVSDLSEAPGHSCEGCLEEGGARERADEQEPDRRRRLLGDGRMSEAPATEGGGVRSGGRALKVDGLTWEIPPLR